jgi:hypothetical protein
LAEASELYQAQLEVNRRAVEAGLDDEFLRQLDEDLAKAYAAMETAWLEVQVA